MGHDIRSVRAAYDRSVERVWFTAVELYGCKTCAAGAVQSLFRTATAEMGGDAPDCAVAGNDLELSMADRFVTRDGEPALKVTGARGIELQDELSQQVKTTWSLLRQVLSCNHCLTATAFFDIRIMHDEIYWDLAGRKGPQAVVCQDCDAGNGQV